jgi:hypothetical protein
LKYLLFTLWGERMTKEDGVEVEGAVKQALFTLVNSVKKHREDGDKEGLKARIEETLRRLHEIADDLEERGYANACARSKTLISTTEHSLKQAQHRKLTYNCTAPKIFVVDDADVKGEGLGEICINFIVNYTFVLINFNPDGRRLL